ncbi:MAG TPA: low affinity iron permease family protein [Xanthobacteraceae bacterium]|jgi:low affinity Fe/Cu permease|nr:low affinity iron permease family protein [Xanthobacteraceae bacterium]
MRHIITQAGVYTAKPISFVLLAAYVLLWAAFGRASLDWNGVATLSTLFMALVIQRAERRDTQAIHAKLDEVLHALGDARNEISRVDEKEPEEIEAERHRMQMNS